MGSIKQVIFAAVVGVLICSVVSSLASPWAWDSLCCAGLRAAHAAAGSERHNLCRPSVSNFPGVSSCSWPAFSLLGRNLPFAQL